MAFTISPVDLGWDSAVEVQRMIINLHVEALSPPVLNYNDTVGWTDVSIYKYNDKVPARVIGYPQWTVYPLSTKGRKYRNNFGFVARTSMSYSVCDTSCVHVKFNAKYTSYVAAKTIKLKIIARQTK